MIWVSLKPFERGFSMEFKKGDAVIDTSDDTIMIVVSVSPQGRGTIVKAYCPITRGAYTYFVNDGYLKKL